MELYDEEVKKQKSKAPMIIGISISILTVVSILIIVLIVYLKSAIRTVTINNTRMDSLYDNFYLESKENELELYIPILKISSVLGYEGYNGDYKDKSEDKTKCHVVCENETAMFTMDSNVLVKISKDSANEYIELDKPVIEKDGQLYATIQGIENAFNVRINSDKEFKNLKIYTMDFLFERLVKNLKLEEYSEKFSDKKAVLDNMMIIKENNQYGVIDVTQKPPKAILESKYEAISYLPFTKDFLVKSNGKYGIVEIVDKKTNMKVKNIYDEIKIMDNQNGLYLVKQNNVYGVININGESIIEPEYKQIGIDISKYSANGVDNKYILLDEVIPIKNENNLWGFFNLKGEKVIDFKYTHVGCKESNVANSYPALVMPSHKIIIVEKDKYYNLLTTSGEELVPDQVINTVYFKKSTLNEETQFYMTSGNNTKTLNINEWLTSIGR